MEFWGDNVESIRHFSASTQRSSKHLEDIIVLPVSEVFLDPQAQKLASHRLRPAKNAKIMEYLQRREHFPGIERYLPYFYEKTETLWDYLPENCLVVNWDPLNIQQELDNYQATRDQERQGEENPDPGSLDRKNITVSNSELPCGSFWGCTTPLKKISFISP